MLTGVTTRTMQVFGVVISSVTGDFELEVDVTKVNKKELLILENPRYNQLIEGNSHLEGVGMLVHLILGAKCERICENSDRRTFACGSSWGPGSGVYPFWVDNHVAWRRPRFITCLFGGEFEL